MSDLTIEQRREEIAKQQEALRQQEADLARQEREQRQAREAAAREAAIRLENEKKETVLVQIRAAVSAARPGLNFTIDTSYFRVDGDRYTTYVDIVQKTRGASRWSMDKIPGMYDVTIGNYGDKHRFPAKKDKSHSYDKIAAYLLGRYDAEMYKRKQYQQEEAAKVVRQNNREFNAPLAQLLRDQFGLTGPGRVTIAPSTEEGKVVVNLPQSLQLTPEKASELLAALKQVGIIE